MKRRDLIKTGLLAMGGAAVALSGCNKDTKTAKSSSLDIVPKQTDTYKFSVPLPFNYEVIDTLAGYNQRFKKSQVETFYNSMPLPLSKNFNRWFQIDRGENPNVKTYQDFANFVKYAQDHGFRICYLMNSPKSMSEKDYKSLEGEFHRVLDFLAGIGVKEIKVANTQVASLINEYKEFDLSSSTAAEYHNISQYKHLIHNYPNIKLIDVAIDENQNFKFLRALKKSFPDVKIEMMVNEACMKGCPARISHASELLFKQFECKKISRDNGSFYSFFKTGAIYPWNLPYYSAIGINNFKFMPNGSVGLRANFTKLIYLENYLKIAEEGIDSVSAWEFLNETYITYIPINQDLKLSTIIPYMPDIKHFVKHGHKCATNCDVDCHYCRECAREMQNFLTIS